MSGEQSLLKRTISSDGTSIAFEQVGSGDPLILVHGTGGDRSRWALVAPKLAQHFTVCMLDRRGRGASADSPDYAIQREYEDIAAVAACFDSPVTILGHSFGAACVLGAAPHIPNLNRLILYEPPMLKEQQTPQRANLLQRMDEALAYGNPETVVTILTNEMLRVPMPVIERMRATSAWAVSVLAARTVPRELRCSDAYGADQVGLNAIQAPTLFLLGTDSPASFKVTTETLCALLPDARVALLEGQQHSAMLTAPDLFLKEVVRFLK